MKRLLTALALTAIPAVALAAALGSASDVIGSALGETRPATFSVSVSHHGGAVTTVKVQGQKEGSGPEKGWVSIKTQWKGGSDWMNTEAELRVKSGKAFFRLASVTGTNGAPDMGAFTSMKGKWYALDASDPAVRSWFGASMSAGNLGSLFKIDAGRFRTGFSYTFTPFSAESVRGALQSAVPWLIAPESSTPFKAKIDTNLSNEFQFGSLTMGSTFEAKAERQFHAVYVETPTASPALPDGAVRSFYFQASGAPMMEKSMSSSTSSMSSSAMSSSSMSSTEFNHDSSLEMHLPAMAKDPADTRRDRRLAQRAIIDLHGPESKDMKMSVLVTRGLIGWESLAAFDADFSQGRGILYRYSKPTNVRFSARDAYAGLEVVYFDAAGRYISSVTMPRCQAGACPTYSPDSPASFALETGVGFLDRTKIGTLWRLSLDWSSAPVAGSNTQESDRTAARLIENRLQIPAPVGWHMIESSGGDQSLRVLAETVATRLRIADIAAAASARHDQEAAHRLYSTLVDTIHKNNLRYAFIIVPTKTADTFTLVLDSYTYAPVDVLDANGNGVLDNDEKPAAVGSSYLYATFTDALFAPVFDQSNTGDLGVYVPVKDDNGTTVAILALVEHPQK